MTAALQTNMFEAVSVSTYCFSLALSALISAGLLLIWHGYLLITNQVPYTHKSYASVLL